MSLFASLCATTSVALGALYMSAAGAPQRYLVVNAAALAAGVIAATLARRSPLLDRRWPGAFAVLTGLLLLATALFGIHIEGAARWIRVAGISFQPSLIFLPLAVILFARNRDWVSPIGLSIAAVGLAMQPDRAMAGTLAAALAVLWLYRREPRVMVALAAAVFGFAATMLRPDVVAPVAFVEQVVQSAFAFHLLAGLAIVAGLVTMMAPVAVGFGRTKDRAVSAVFVATWIAVIVFAIVGNYPTPLVGYGSSAIVGYCLSVGALTR